MKFAFNKSAIEALKPEAKRRWYGDTKVRGLMLAVHPTGRKQFYLNRRIGRGMEKIALGPFPDLAVDAARRKAEQLNSQIAEGRNPPVRPQRTRLRDPGRAFRLYYERHARRKKKAVPRGRPVALAALSVEARKQASQ
ncbi:MAG: DUF4102 domain-containing protein [Xanthomonadales bacterium]|nr:DUF4102 domain-containing protein [Xanthomonadales bacterium]